MSKQNPEPDVPVRAVDRILAFTALGLAAAAVLSFFAIILGTAFGMEHDDFASGIWQFISIIPWCLPIAFLLILTLLIMSFVRKGRAAKRS